MFRQLRAINSRLLWQLAVAAAAGFLVVGCGGSDHPAAPPPTVDLSISPATINSGEATTLTWTSMGAASCLASGGWSGSQTVNGSQAVVVASAGSVTYTLTC